MTWAGAPRSMPESFLSSFSSDKSARYGEYRPLSHNCQKGRLWRSWGTLPYSCLASQDAPGLSPFGNLGSPELHETQFLLLKYPTSRELGHCP